MYKRQGAILVYVYRPARVAKLLADDRTLAFLAGEGYAPGTADELLAQLADTGSFSFSPSGKAITAEITPEDLRAKLG